MLRTINGCNNNNNNKKKKRRRIMITIITISTAKLASHFAPIQLGVGTPGGAEAAIHAVRRYAEHFPKDYIIVKLDFKNAFYTLRRDSMFGENCRSCTTLPMQHTTKHQSCNSMSSSSSLQKDHSKQIHWVRSSSVWQYTHFLEDKYPNPKWATSMTSPCQAPARLL